jgi:uncharacterized protein YdhG (YjbR/CyaY superfamily)
VVTPRKFRSIDEYIDSFPTEVASILQTVRQIVKDEAPDAEETIKYQLPTFTLNGNLVYFGAWKRHIGLYPPISENVPFKQELAPYEGPKGNFQFPLDKPLPIPLIRKIVRFRVEESVGKKQAGKKRSV